MCRKICKKEVKLATVYLHDLVHRRNTLSPTCRLPTELILHILCFLHPVVTTGHHLRITGTTQSKARPLDPNTSPNQIGDATRNIVATSHTCSQLARLSAD